MFYTNSALNELKGTKYLEIAFAFTTSAVKSVLMEPNDANLPSLLLGGDAKLLVMLCVSPTQHFLSETLQSLGFGYRARQIQRDTPHRRNAGLKRK